MTQGEDISPNCCNKRKRSLGVKVRMNKLTNFLKTNFQKIRNLETDNDLQPLKKRKISHVINENLYVNDIPEYIVNNLAKLKLNDQEVKHDAPKLAPPHLYPTYLLEKYGNKLLEANKKSSEDKTQIRKRKVYTKRSPNISDLIASTSHQNLLNKFENCINFIRLSRLEITVDIDDIVRNFSTFGKVLSIQDHWIQPRGFRNKYTSLWLGATVTYKCATDAQCALKAYSIKKTDVMGVSLVEHLSRIHSVESEYMSQFGNFELEGTSICVGNIWATTLRSKMRDVFNLYGTVLQIQWLSLKLKGCIVTYKTTTGAVAAALALDGKKMQRSILRAVIKMRFKEIFIHRKLCESY